MQNICAEHKSSINIIHTSTIITATAQLWQEAQQHPRFTHFQRQAHCQVVTFLRSVLCLHPLLQDVDPRAVSNICWSLAKVGVHPDALVPGMMDSLTANFVNRVEAQNAKHRPNAQDMSNFTWGCAVFKHTPSDAAMSSVSGCFMSIMEAQDVQDRPNAHDMSTFIWGCAILDHKPSDAALSSTFRCFVKLMEAQDVRDRPRLQGVSNLVWAYAIFKHAPSDADVSSVLRYFVCGVLGKKPDFQTVSDLMFACAVLGVDVKQEIADVLALVLLDHDKDRPYTRHYCNTAWSLAVLGVLHYEVFEALLSQLPPPKSLTPRAKHLDNTDEVINIGLAQLCQALYFVQPTPSAPAEQHKAWGAFEKALSTFGPRPTPDPTYGFPGNQKLCFALTELGLHFEAKVPVLGNWADAVLQPTSNCTPAVMIVVATANDCLANIGNR